MNLRTLTVLLLLGGCASRSPEPPPVVVPQSTWEWVDWDIVAASQTAADGAQAYARSNMEQWKTLVRQRTETEFIPAERNLLLIKGSVPGSDGALVFIRSAAKHAVFETVKAGA